MRHRPLGVATNPTRAEEEVQYDYDGQLTQITQGGNTTSFAYDALGRRFSRTAGGTTTQFQYAGSAVLLEKQGGTTTGVYTYGQGLLRRGGEYPLFDGSGSERTVTNSSQTVTGSINFEAFGQTAGSSGSSSSPFMFAGDWGYRTDGDAGLMKVGARYYDAQVGRFITRDSYLDQHPYLYCRHEPVGFVDAEGHISGWKNLVGDIAIGIGIGIIAVIVTPVGAGVAIGAAIGFGLGAIAGGAQAANDYYWEHGDTDTWDQGEFQSQIGFGAVETGMEGLVAGGVVGLIKGALSPPPGGLFGRLLANGQIKRL